MSRRRRQFSTPWVAPREHELKRMADLLHQVCIDRGFCGSGNIRVTVETMTGIAPVTPSRFADEVLRSEGFDLELDNPEYRRYLVLEFRRFVGESFDPATAEARAKSDE